MLVDPSHQLASSREVTLAECARQTVIAHNDPSHMRDRVLRLFEQHHIPANILVSLPSLEGIKRAVSMQMGVALLPRRCAELEIARGELVALAMPEIRLRRQVRHGLPQEPASARTPPPRSWAWSKTTRRRAAGSRPRWRPKRDVAAGLADPGRLKAAPTKPQSCTADGCAVARTSS